ncbi:MAG: hypothetical protein D8B51_08275 [Tannerella sp.]|nr:MAG: hypothetical protein D8B51_08275 [Tannerella sp.]
MDRIGQSHGRYGESALDSQNLIDRGIGRQILDDALRRHEEFRSECVRLPLFFGTGTGAAMSVQHEVSDLMGEVESRPFRRLPPCEEDVGKALIPRRIRID